MLRRISGSSSQGIWEGVKIRRGTYFVLVDHVSGAGGLRREPTIGQEMEWLNEGDLNMWARKGLDLSSYPRSAAS